MVLSSLISASAASTSPTSLLLSSRNFFSFTRQDTCSNTQYVVEKQIHILESHWHGNSLTNWIETTAHVYKLHDNFPSKIVSSQKPFTRSLSYILSLADCSFNTFFNAVANWLDFSFSAVTASNAFSASYKPHPNLIKHTSKVIFETDLTSFQPPITFSMPRSRSTMNV